MFKVQTISRLEMSEGGEVMSGPKTSLRLKINWPALAVLVLLLASIFLSGYVFFRHSQSVRKVGTISIGVNSIGASAKMVNLSSKGVMDLTNEQNAIKLRKELIIRKLKKMTPSTTTVKPVSVQSTTEPAKTTTTTTSTMSPSTSSTLTTQLSSTSKPKATTQSPPTFGLTPRFRLNYRFPWIWNL